MAHHPPHHPEAERETKKCRSCGNLIDKSATVCDKCGKYQAGWRNELMFFSSVIGLGSVLIASLAFSANQIAIFFSADDLEIVAFRSDEHLAVYNGGRTPTIVTTIDYSSPNWGFHSKNIYRVINAGDLGEFNADSHIEDFLNAAVPGKFICALAGGSLDTLKGNSKVHPLFASEADPEIAKVVKEFEQNGNVAKAEACDATLHYAHPGNSLTSGSKDLSIPCIVVLKSEDPGLQASHVCKVNVK